MNRRLELAEPGSPRPFLPEANSDAGADLETVVEVAVERSTDELSFTLNLKSTTVCRRIPIRVLQA